MVRKHNCHQKEPLSMEIQYKDEFRGELLREIFSIQEEERRRIARELHDETCQALSSLNANLATALEMLPGGTAKVKSRLKEAQDISINILDDIHKLIYELRPTLLDDLGLCPAVRWLAEVNLGAAGINVIYSTIGKEKRLSPHLETTFFRIIKEAISNIIRHAHARNASISLHFQRQAITAHIKDDGNGFDVEEAINSKDRPRGLGLLGMKERVELVNGTINIFSRTGGGGTEITVEIPLGQEVSSGKGKNIGGR